jgi:RecA-family ATPase
VQLVTHPIGKERGATRTNWLLEGVISRNAPTLWYGLPKIGKSNVLYSLFPILETGGEWLGFKVHGTGHKTLVVHLDTDPDLAAENIEAAYRGANLTECHVAVRSVSDAIEVNELGRKLQAAVREQRASLLVLDSFQNLPCADPNSDTAVTQVLRAVFGPVLAAGCAVVVVDHVHPTRQWSKDSLGANGCPRALRRQGRHAGTLVRGNQPQAVALAPGMPRVQGVRRRLARDADSPSR